MYCGPPRGISDPNCHLAEQRIVGVVEGEQEGGAMPAPAEGPAKGWGAEAVYPGASGIRVGALPDHPSTLGGWTLRS